MTESLKSSSWVRGVARLVKCLSGVHEALDSIPRTTKPKEALKSSKSFEPNLGYMRPFLKKQNNSILSRA